MTQLSDIQNELHALAEQGLLRRLSPAFSAFIASLDTAPAPDALLLCSALVCELEGRGHSCLDLNDLHPHPGRLLSWEADTWRALQARGELPHDARAWRQALSGCRQVRVTPAPDQQQPLVLDGDRLYLRRYWCDETLVAESVTSRARAAGSPDTAALRDWLDRLFGAAAGSDEPDWQKAACALALRSHFSIITGGPGTGKTYTAARLLALLYALAPDARELRVALAAPTGKAATRLKQSIDGALADLAGKVGELPLAELTAGMPATTLHSLLGARPDTRRPRHHRGNPLDIDVLIVDEASMVHLEMMAALLDALPAPARLILLGDKDQLASVEAGAVLGDLCRDAEEGAWSDETMAYLHAATGHAIPGRYRGNGGPVAQQTVMLRVSRRFGGPIGALARAVNDGEVEAAQAVLRARERGVLAWNEHARQSEVLDLALHGREGAPASLARYLALLRAGPPHEGGHEQWVREVLAAFDEFRILCAVRAGDWGVAGINAAIEARLTETGVLACRGEWYPGRPVMVTRNDPGLGVYNGDVGITLPDPGRRGSLRVYFGAGDTVRSVLATRLPQVETAFAMTVHKVQGSEFLHAALVLPPVAPQLIARELIYTGITRAREYFTLLSPEPAVAAEAIARRTTRASGLEARVGGES
ncbi:exodeoxyribonuclease V subunit alpha [Noviherbaspirillum aridicola]|uniref:RecBCD enzyme subunit RecD n=1 Tax=Noviherbaspirillum aridicola TaxID=2849687 RepID=A0ABQ4Q911_9BURK|nr:exodeoxyribonuclease V subunit alpha [Noviherbaspirillum aridicola]GIZ53693.1 RecBCD enzyme subunit RecD [Noviherbaspirillum aridicola]